MYKSTNLLDFITPGKEQEALMLRIIELDKLKKIARSVSSLQMEVHKVVSSYIGDTHNFDEICSHFDELLTDYLRRFGPDQIRCVVVRDPSNRSHTQVIKLENQDSVLFDTRFGKYQFIKFKFTSFNHICAILPFLWFTIHFTFTDPLITWIPEVNDTQTLKIFKLKDEI